MRPDKIPFSGLRPGQVFRFRGQWYARCYKHLSCLGYQMFPDFSGYYKAVGFLPSTLVVPSPQIENGPLPMPRKAAS
ncbi:MAG: hypothetical protein F9K25_19965 [Candidatus Contendobacter sp.]|nr:MAG: hypothetical protein F9K25_19965 [Candidatus Contendobacter sp.]